MHVVAREREGERDTTKSQCAALCVWSCSHALRGQRLWAVCVNNPNANPAGSLATVCCSLVVWNSLLQGLALLSQPQPLIGAACMPQAFGHTSRTFCLGPHCSGCLCWKASTTTTTTTASRRCSKDSSSKPANSFGVELLHQIHCSSGTLPLFAAVAEHTAVGPDATDAVDAGIKTSLQASRCC